MSGKKEQQFVFLRLELQWYSIQSYLAAHQVDDQISKLVDLIYPLIFSNQIFPVNRIRRR
jgi:hypothetical protein